MSAPILIFGATGGIGSAVARQLARTKAPLFLTARDEDRLAALAKELNAEHATCDVLDPDSIGAVVERAGGGDGLAGLCYAVGSIVVKPLKRAEAEDFAQAFALNATGAALAVRAAAPALTKGRGSVLLFSTVAVGQGFPNHCVISAAKGAVEGLTRALAAELAPKVRVNAIAPSLTKTPLSAAMTKSEALANALAEMHPLQRLGQPEDMAALGALLLGRDHWISGQVFGVDGGRSRLRTRD